MDNIEKTVTKLEERLRSMSDKNMSAQQRLQALEELMDMEDRAQKAVNKETDRINGLIYRSQLQLAKFREDDLALKVMNIKYHLDQFEIEMCLLYNNYRWTIVVLFQLQRPF